MTVRRDQGLKEPRCRMAVFSRGPCVLGRVVSPSPGMLLAEPGGTREAGTSSERIFRNKSNSDVKRSQDLGGQGKQSAQHRNFLCRLPSGFSVSLSKDLTEPGWCG